MYGYLLGCHLIMHILDILGLEILIWISSRVIDYYARGYPEAFYRYPMSGPRLRDGE